MKKTKWQPDEFWFLAILVMAVGGVLGIREAVTQGQYGASIFLVLGSLVSIAFLYAHEWLRAHKQDRGERTMSYTSFELATNDILRPAPERVDLNVPYAEREAAKRAGAKWDKEAKTWYAPKGADLDKLARWNTGKAAKSETPPRPEEEFAEALRSVGCIVDGEHPIMETITLRITIPPDVSFNDLNLSLTGDGYVRFDLAALGRVCEASGLSMDGLMQAPEDYLGSLLCAWYDAHIRLGGTPDPVAEHLNAEMRAEVRAGQPWSFPAGSA